MELTKLAPGEFDTVWAAMEEAFPREERRERAEAQRLLHEGRYRVYIAQKDGERVGFITVWELESFTYAEHFVIYAAHRNKGYGAEVLRALKAIYPRLLLEAEPPEDDLKRRRLAFYRRNGFCQNDFPYLQPSYHEPGAEVPLVLMSYPTPLSDPEAAARELYRCVYEKPYPERQA